MIDWKSTVFIFTNECSVFWYNCVTTGWNNIWNIKGSVCFCVRSVGKIYNKWECSVLFYPLTVVMLNISFTTHLSHFFSANLQLPVVRIIFIQSTNRVGPDQTAYLLIMLESLICEHHIDIKLRISGVVVTVFPCVTTKKFYSPVPVGNKICHSHMTNAPP